MTQRVRQEKRDKNNYQGVNTQQRHSLVSKFLGYRNKEDISNIPAGYLVSPSQNVVVNTAGRLSIVGGYTLDGATSTYTVGIASAFDQVSSVGTEVHIRTGGQSWDSTNNTYVIPGVAQYRYVSPTGTVSWRDLITGLKDYQTDRFNFVDYWNNTELKSSILMVNGTANIYEWSGAITTFASCTSNTITKEGITSWAEAGFFSTTSGRAVVIGGTTYTYTGGESTKTLTGVSPDPTGGSYAAGTVIHQAVITTANAGGTGKLPTTIGNDLIGLLNNQIYIADKTNRTVYVSKINSYTDFAYTSPTRKPGEGAVLTLDGNPVAFIPQEQDMYISDANNGWYKTNFTLSSDLTGESLTVEKLKTSSLQGAKSQAFVSKVKNDVAFVSNEPTLDTLGRIQNILGTPQSVNLSDPIKTDFDSYDFTDGCVAYYKNKIYLAVPRKSLIRIYNLQPGIDSEGNIIPAYWEAPITYPISRFSIINGLLYGHSYLTMESYKLFDGYNFNGQPILANAYFSYQNFGIRELTKWFNTMYVEGYISLNTTLTFGAVYEMDGNATYWSKNILGNNEKYVAIVKSNASLGKNALGKNPLGGDSKVSSGALPPKFRIFPVSLRINGGFYEIQFYFSSNQKDAQWELLAFGALTTRTMYGNNFLKD